MVEEKLAPRVRSSFLANDRTYGARRVWHDVLAAGFCCGLHRIERLMRAQALRARPRRSGLPKDRGERHAAPVPPNLLDRQFTATRQNQKWVADFTYVWTAEGWLDVAAVNPAIARRQVPPARLGKWLVMVNGLILLLPADDRASAWPTAWPRSA